jgi:hypothetical protein
MGKDIISINFFFFSDQIKDSVKKRLPRKLKKKIKKSDPNFDKNKDLIMTQPSHKFFKTLERKNRKKKKNKK